MAWNWRHAISPERWKNSYNIYNEKSLISEKKMSITSLTVCTVKMKFISTRVLFPNTSWLYNWNKLGFYLWDLWQALSPRFSQSWAFFFGHIVWQYSLPPSAPPQLYCEWHLLRLHRLLAGCSHLPCKRWGQWDVRVNNLVNILTNLGCSHSGADQSLVCSCMKFDQSLLSLYQIPLAPAATSLTNCAGFYIKFDQSCPNPQKDCHISPTSPESPNNPAHL